ncbi:hypothetical protein JOC95_000197 [Bacillus tianshenii]|uniref:DUF8042 domain-containing protein n=1 Tax=Sutcliffiella tianshenii TaxID=1463404 RepID=A0ABS2NUL9_9BACI|nr:hypothetical protein [Bacillus tianshenii]MBM7618355.1 hypothetical protein [Bacillus tianshenii]
MMRLKEEEFLVLQQYNGLLESLEEAFLYLCDNAGQPESSAVKKVKENSYLAISKIAETHVFMVNWFSHDEAALRAIGQFEGFIDELESLGHFSAHPINEKEVFSTYLIPAFEEWKVDMQKQLLPFLTH